MLIISTNSIFCSEQNSLLHRNRRVFSTSFRPVLGDSSVHFSPFNGHSLSSNLDNYSPYFSRSKKYNFFSEDVNQIFYLRQGHQSKDNLSKKLHSSEVGNSAIKELKFSEIFSVEISNMAHEEKQSKTISSFKMNHIGNKEWKNLSLSNVSVMRFFFNYFNEYSHVNRSNNHMLKNYSLACSVVSIPRNPVPLIDCLSEQQNKSEACRFIFFDPGRTMPSLLKDCQRSFISKEIQSLKYCESDRNIIEKTDCAVQTDEKIEVKELDKGKLQQYKEQVVNLKEQILNLQRELEAVNNENHQGKEREEKLQQKLLSLERELEVLKKELENLQGECKKTSDEKVLLEDKSRGENLQNNKLVTELREKIVLLEEKLTNLNSKSQEKEKINGDLTRDLEVLKQEKDLQDEEYKKQQESLNNELLKLKNQLLELTNKLNKLEDNKVELENKLKISEGEKEYIKNNLEKEKIELKTQIASLEKQLQEQKSNLEDKITSLKKDFADLQNKKDLESEENKNNQGKLERQLLELTNKLNNLEANKVELENELKILAEEKEEIKNNLENIEKEKENLDEDVKEIDNLKLNINNQKNDIKKNISLFRKIIGFRSDDYKEKKEELKELETDYKTRKENLLKKFLSESDMREMEEKKKIIEEADVLCKIKSFFSAQNDYNKSKEHLENMYHKIVSNHLTIYQAIPDEYQTFLIVYKDRNFVCQIKDIFMSKSLRTKIMFLSAPVISCGFCGWLAFSKSTFSSVINSFSGVINSCIERYNLKEKYPDILKYFGFLFATKTCGDFALRVVSSENPCAFYSSQKCANNINRGTHFCEKCVKNQQLAYMRENYLKANHIGSY